jgi:hypothetical protein
LLCFIHLAAHVDAAAGASGWLWRAWLPFAGRQLFATDR